MQGNRFKIQGAAITATAGTLTTTTLIVRPGAGKCVGYRAICQSSVEADILNATMNVTANADVVSSNESLSKYSWIYNDVPFIVRFDPIEPNSTIIVTINVPGATNLNVVFELLFNQ